MLFKKHHTNECSSYCTKIAFSIHTDPLKYIESTPSNSFYLAPVTQTQVSTLFAGLKENKASLNVPNKLIKLASGQLSAPFTEIYNESILSGEFPEIFKYQK